MTKELAKYENTKVRSTDRVELPTEFPDLRQVDEIAIDLETRDPDLIKKGSGAVVGNGEVIGIAVATAHYKGYFPIGHHGGGNMDRKKVLEWFQRCFTSRQYKNISQRNV